MRIDKAKVIEIVRGIKPLFENHEKAGHIKKKSEQDFVTEVDTEVQRRVSEALYKLYPDVQMLGEEKDNSEIDITKDLWILDPVDGTTNLIYDFRISALSLGYVEDGELVFGVVYQPFTDELYEAEKGKGAYLNGKRIHVSSSETIHESLISFGTKAQVRDESPDQYFRTIERLFLDCIDVRRLGAASMDLCYVAAGRSDAFFERYLDPWDFAAGIIIVKEAGGDAVDYSGNPLAPAVGSQIVATNGKITKELLGYLS